MTFLYLFLAVFILSFLIHLPAGGPVPAPEPEKEEEGGGVQSSPLLPILLEAFRRGAPNSRGAGSMDYLNLSTAIQKLEAGEDVPPEVCVYLLQKLGAEDLAEKLKTGAGA